MQLYSIFNGGLALAAVQETGIREVTDEIPDGWSATRNVAFWYPLPIATCADSESRWPLVPHAESALQCYSSAPDRALIEEPPDQSHTVRHSARRRELRQWVI